MNVTHLNAAELTEEWFAASPDARMTMGFPMWQGEAPHTGAIVYMPMLRGGVVLPHNHDVEELLLILEGIVEVDVEGDAHIYGPGQVIYVSERAEHSIRNLGPADARAVGFFPSARVVTTFREPLMPDGVQVYAEDGGLQITPQPGY
jgi:quercetin dioxygenase-like cupin family protein